jgi:hypothetical protein
MEVLTRLMALAAGAGSLLLGIGGIVGFFDGDPMAIPALGLAVALYFVAKRLSKNLLSIKIPKDRDKRMLLDPSSYYNYTDQQLGYSWTPISKIRESVTGKSLNIDRFRFFPEISQPLQGDGSEKHQQRYDKATSGAEQVQTSFEPLDFTKTVLAVGGMGSGKTEFFNAILHQNARFDHFRRTVIHDVKGDFVEKFYNPATDFIFNPYDQRGFAWDIWEDMNEYEGLITSFIKNLIESGIKEADFFSSSAARLLNEFFLKAHFENRGRSHSVKWAAFFDLIEDYEAQGEEDKTKSSIYATMELAIEHFKMMRWLQEQDAPPFSIKDFLAGTGNLYLLNNAAYSKKLNPLFTGFVALLIEVLLSRPDTKTDLTLLLLDEFLSLKFDEDTRLKLLTQIRSKGGCLLIGIQYIPKDDKKAQQLLDSSKYALIMFRVNDHETVKHMIETFGKVQYVAKRVTNSRAAKGGGSRSVSRSVEERPFITTDMLQSMPPYHHLTFIPDQKIVYLGYTDLADLSKIGNNFEKRDLEGFYKALYEKKETTTMNETPEPETNSDTGVDSEGVEYSISATSAALEKYPNIEQRIEIKDYLDACESFEEYNQVIEHYGLDDVSIEAFIEDVAEV